MNRLFKGEGRIVIAAVDQGSHLGPIQGLEDPSQAIGVALEASPEAILTSVGVANRYAGLLREGNALVLSLQRTHDAASAVRHATKIGADAVRSLFFLGIDDNQEGINRLSNISIACKAAGMPHLVEVAPPRSEPERSARERKAIESALKVAVKSGADMIQMFFISDNWFRKMVGAAGVPLLVMGQGISIEKSDEAFFEGVAEALRAGAAGIIVGREIWQHRSPRRMMNAVMTVVHGGSVEEALSVVDAGS